MSSEPAITAESLFNGSGEMAALMRSIDWSRTPLGPVARWPSTLRTLVSTMVASPYPIVVYWGPALVQLYNDSGRQFFGSKHPASFARPAREVLGDIWELIGPMFERVLATGVATYLENQPVFLERGPGGRPEECYFTWSYIPTRGEGGNVDAIFTIASEATRQVLSERRMRTLRELSIRTASDQNVEAVFAAVQTTLADAVSDVPFSLLYVVQGETARLVSCTGLPHSGPESPVEVARGAPSPWPIHAVAKAGAEQLIEDVQTRLGTLPGGLWPEPARDALVLPIVTGADGSVGAVLVTGLSPRLPLGAEYREFLQQLARQIGAGISSARAYEQERQRAEALAELDKAKTTFFSNISHELRTPLTLILGPLEDMLASGAVPLPTPHRERADLIRRNARRLYRLVNALLEFSRLEAGRADATFVPIDLAAFTSELASLFESAARNAGLSFEVRCPPLPEPVYVDRDAWEKIVLNLISNALKFTVEGGITVSLEADGQSARLVVRDTGTGIPESELPHVFNRFHRVEAARARSHEGSGIGLALVHELVKLHGGSIEVQSRLGEGTVFAASVPFGTAHLPPHRVKADGSEWLPSVRASAFVDEALGWVDASPDAPLPSDGAVPEAAHHDNAGTAPARARVLLADDNADLRAYVGGILARHFAVESVANGEAALNAARRNPPDLIVSDVMMPRLDGFALLREVRADERLRAIPVILLSARAGEEASAEGVEAGADDYLVKPFAARELVARVRTHLELTAIRREVARRAALEETLREQVRAREEFLSVASHELKTPLSSLGLQLELVRRALPPTSTDDAARRIEAATRQVQRLRRTIDQMLDISALTHGLTLTRQEGDFAALLEEIVDEYRPVLNRVGSQLNLEAQAPFVFSFDAARMRQVIANLLENAAKYGEGKPVTVALRRTDGFAELRVADQGIGIAPDVQERIFERFERAVATRHYQGLGLGLWIVRQLVAAHGGTIRVDSALGSGSKFTVSLPLDA